MVLSRLRTLFKEWKQNHNNGKEFCKINKELAEEYASIFNLDRTEDVAKLRELLLKDQKFIDQLKREVGYGIGRRAFIATLASLGLLEAVRGVDAKTVIGGKSITLDDTYYFPQVIPASAIVYKGGSKVIARNMFGKVIADGKSPDKDAEVVQSALDVGGRIFILTDMILDTTLYINNNNTEIYSTNKTLTANKALSALIKVSEDVSNLLISDIIINGKGIVDTVLDLSSTVNIVSPINIINSKIYGGINKNIDITNRQDVRMSATYVGERNYNTTYGIYASNLYGVVWLMDRTVLQFCKYGMYIDNGHLHAVNTIIHGYSSGVVASSNAKIRLVNCWFENQSAYAIYNDNTVIAESIHSTNSYIGGQIYGTYKYIILNGDYLIYDTNTFSSHINATTIIYTKGTIFLARGDYVNITGKYNIFNLATTKLISNVKNSGIAHITADGVATTFYIPHGLVTTPNYVNVIPKAGAPAPSSIDADATNIILTFSAAPAAGTYYYWWEAKI